MITSRRSLVRRSREIAKLLRENRVAPFEMDDSLADARESELTANVFDRQFLASFGAFARHTGNFLGACAFAAQKLERMANLGKFKIGGGGANDYGVARSFEFDPLSFGASLGCFQLSAQRQIENGLRIRKVENRWRLAADG